MAVGWDTAITWTGLPSSGGDTTADVCVVGLGGSGLAAVEAALDRGLSVVGLDAGHVAAGAAGRNGGFLLGGPAPFVHDALTQCGSPAIDLYRETLAELDRLEASLPPGTVRRVGVRANCTRSRAGRCGYSGTGNLVGPVAARAGLAYALDGTVPPPYFTT